MRLLIIFTISFILMGCESAELKKGGLYVNKNTCVGMDDLGVAKIKQHF